MRVPSSKLVIKKINYDSGTASVQYRGTLFLCVLTNNITATQMMCSGTARMRYYD